MPRTLFLFPPSLFLAAVLLAGCATGPAVDPGATPDYEGLVEVRAKRFSTARVRPGVDFTAYNAVHILEPELEFRPVDRSQQAFPLDGEQKARFRDMLAAAFQDAFAADAAVAVVNHDGPEVVTLTVRVVDIAVTVPPRAVARGGRGAIALEARGSVTLILEVRDSESGAVLARGIDTVATTGAARVSGGDMITRWDDVDRVCDEWAASARAGLEVLLAVDGR
jgi:hypothetical protein